MIFLVVKVNYSSSVFNTIKSIWLLKNVKNNKVLEKRLKAHTRWFVYFLQVITSYQENKQKLQPNSLLSVERWLQAYS